MERLFVSRETVGLGRYLDTLKLWKWVPVIWVVYGLLSMLLSTYYIRGGSSEWRNWLAVAITALWFGFLVFANRVGKRAEAEERCKERMNELAIALKEWSIVKVAFEVGLPSLVGQSVLIVRSTEEPEWGKAVGVELAGAVRSEVIMERFDEDQVATRAKDVGAKVIVLASQFGRMEVFLLAMILPHTPIIFDDGLVFMPKNLRYGSD
jgi:hypothetical protein